LSEIEVEKRFSRGFTCTHCNEENQALSKKLNLRSDYQNDQFLEEISNLSKKGFLDEGIYLTEIGSDLIKKIKIKPSPSVRRNRAPKLPVVSESNDLHHNKLVEKHLDEASRSSSEDKADTHHHEEMIADLKPVELKAKAKRQVNVGMGGFNPKSRSRTKANPNEHDAESEAKTGL
jgi:AAA15 family ATPase/GTPase